MFRARHPTVGLDAYLDGELAATEADHVRSHLEDCPGCAEAAHTTLAIGRTLRHLAHRRPLDLAAARLQRWAHTLHG